MKANFIIYVSLGQWSWSWLGVITKKYLIVINVNLKILECYELKNAFHYNEELQNIISYIISYQVIACHSGME